MQIQAMPPRGGQVRHLPVEEKGEARLLAGGKGYAVKVGERMVGFSGEQVSSVSLEVHEGGLEIKLLEAGGSAVRELRVPGIQSLEKLANSLNESEIVFSAGERQELERLMRLSFAGSMDRSSLVMLLDEISHVAASVDGPASIDTGDLHGALNQRLNTLLKAMPEEIQRYVILSNRERIPEEAWRALWLLSNADPDRDPFLMKFLAGDIPLTDRVRDDIASAASRTLLNSAKDFPAIDPEAFKRLAAAVKEIQLSGNSSFFRIDSRVANLVFDHFQLAIPDFSASRSFESLEIQLIQKGLSTVQGALEDPLAKLLLSHLDTRQYKELAEFLNGREGARWSLEVRESLLHFLRQKAGEAGDSKISSIVPDALKRLNGFLDRPEYRGIKEQMRAKAESVPMKNLSEQLPDVARFERLPTETKLATFLVEHLDPKRDQGLFHYFAGGHKLAKLTPAMIQELEHLLAGESFPSVRAELSGVVPERLQELARWLAKNYPRHASPIGFFPRNNWLEQIGLPELLPVMENGMQGESHTAHKRVPQAEQIARQLDGLEPRQRDQMLSDILKRFLPSFDRVALLDQVWKAQRLVRAMSLEPNSLHELGHELSRSLRTVMGLLGGPFAAEPSWDLWQAAQEPVPASEPRPSARQRLLRDEKGVQRYFRLAEWLPEGPAGLEDQLTRLAWLRRLDRFTRAVDLHRGENHTRLLETVTRGDKALTELAEFLLEGSRTQWERLARSPLTKRKQRDFEVFRQLLVEGKSPDPSNLFKGPFLRGAFGEGAEKIQRREMERLEPVFREVLARAASSDSLATQLQSMLRNPGEAAPEIMSRLRDMVDIFRDLNQFQNLNDEPLYLSLPIDMGGKTCQFELAYTRLPGAKKDKKRFLVVLHLDFPGWGHLRVDALKERDQLAATFWVENPRMHHALLSDLHLLEDRLEDADMGETTLTVKINPRRATRSVAAMCTAPDDGRLDMEI